MAGLVNINIEFKELATTLKSWNSSDYIKRYNKDV